MKTKYTFAEVKKTVVAVVGFVLTVQAALLSGGLIPVAALPWVLVAISIAGSYGVFAVKNVPAVKPPVNGEVKE
jgi:hypothetical protein